MAIAHILGLGMQFPGGFPGVFKGLSPHADKKSKKHKKGKKAPIEMPEPHRPGGYHVVPTPRRLRGEKHRHERGTQQ